MATKLKMRNLETRELAPAHLLGTDEQDRSIYHAEPGWELIGEEFDADTDSEIDSDGNYHVAN